MLVQSINGNLIGNWTQAVYILFATNSKLRTDTDKSLEEITNTLLCLKSAFRKSLMSIMWILTGGRKGNTAGI